ncbi:MAG: ral stress protein 69 [Verrucomicrobiota bacterium]|jgi:aryl-alcohol dehydrogenase-like predicted oxidoreductase
MKRRAFIRMVGGAGLSAISLERLLADVKPADDITKRVQGLPYRKLGRTGAEISIIGFPGLALMREDQTSSDQAVRHAFDRGLNYYDVAPAYGRDGECEIKLGTALQQLKRDDYFLSCKTKARDKDGAKQELDCSLQRLKTDHFDLYQLHHVVTPEDTRKAFGPGGAMETLLQARKEGKVKWLGFSAHSTQGALTALQNHDFDTVMFPVSFADYYLRDFSRDVLALAEQKGAAVIAIKPMSMGAWPEGVKRTREWWYRTTETPEEISLSLRFSLSMRGVVTGIPPSFVDLLDKAITAANSYKPATSNDREELRELATSCEALFTREDNLGNA